MSWEALRALEKEWRKESDDFERDGDEGTACAYYNCAEQLADILSSRQEVAPVADEYGWVDGAPHRILSMEEGEWFIAETTYGDRVVLKGLPEEYAYDFTTADSTYIKRDKIKRWRQFPDSEYVPLGDTAHTSDARDALDRVDSVLREFESMTGAGYKYMAANIRAAIKGPK